MTVQYSTCTFSGTSEATKYIQGMLVAKGASGLKVDGKWGPCTDSAFRQVFGESISKEALLRHLDIDCGKVTKVEVTTTCGDGSDRVSLASQLLRLPSLQRTAAPLTAQRTGLTSLADKLRAATTPGQPSQSTVVSGVPDWLVGVGLVVAVAGAAYFIRKKR